MKILYRARIMSFCSLNENWSENLRFKFGILIRNKITKLVPRGNKLKLSLYKNKMWCYIFVTPIQKIFLNFNYNYWMHHYIRYFNVYSVNWCCTFSHFYRTSFPPVLGCYLRYFIPNLFCWKSWETTNYN